MDAPPINVEGAVAVSHEWVVWVQARLAEVERANAALARSVGDNGEQAAYAHARAQALTAALAKYGRHHSSCRLARPSGTGMPQPCTCGYDAALDAGRGEGA